MSKTVMQECYEYIVWKCLLLSPTIMGDDLFFQEGFLCAMCMMSLESEDALMSHYDHCSKQGM